MLSPGHRGAARHGTHFLLTWWSVPVAEAEQLLQVYGKNELEEKTTSKLIIFLKLVCFSDTNQKSKMSQCLPD